MKNLLLIASVAQLFWSFPVSAEGDDAIEDDKVVATQAFETGMELFSKDDYLEAAEAFKRAYHLRPHPAVLANIGYCYRRLGDTPRAVEIFRRYLKDPDTKEKKRNKEIRSYLEKAKSKIGDLQISCRAKSCEVKVDDVSRGLAPLNIVLLAGVHNVDVLSIEDSEMRRYEIEIPRGGRLELDVDLSHVSIGHEREAWPQDNDDAARGNGKKAIRLGAAFWTATAITVVGIGSVVTLGVLSNRAKADFQSGGYVDTDLKKRGEDLTLGANIAIGVTAAAAAAALVFAIVDIKRGRLNNGGSPESTVRGRVGVAFACGPSFVGLRGEF